ncbi:hypothetical protein [Glutamicibacter protophormiae]|uniref:hypothetical protein n=1 Tax=Glutamicibacter protophormiae TaxID=37930 RepID=UPI003BB03891
MPATGRTPVRPVASDLTLPCPGQAASCLLQCLAEFLFNHGIDMDAAVWRVLFLCHGIGVGQARPAVEDLQVPSGISLPGFFPPTAADAAALTLLERTAFSVACTYLN